MATVQMRAGRSQPGAWQMHHKTLGRTGMKVSVAGLGCGGNSRLGLGRGASRSECADLVREALDLGVNVLDTAEAYGTEDIVGAAIAGRERSSVVISTKSRIRMGGQLVGPERVIENLDASLDRLGTDHVDVFHLHAVAPKDYAYARDVIAPALAKARDAGKIRHIGITETGPNDPHQKMLSVAVHEEPWDVVMLAYSMLNQGARRNVFPTTEARGIGTLLMFVVRNIFSQPERLRTDLQRLATAGQIPQRLAAADEPLDFLMNVGGAANVTEAAYRFARHAAGADVVLFGTGSRAHLRANIAAINKPPLQQPAIDILHAHFADLVGVGLDLPDHVSAARFP
jgi:aryl-alcohol dehydrogenase-like predicted oxidoreductase